MDILGKILIAQYIINKTDNNDEIGELYNDIIYNRKPNPGLEQAYSVLKIIKNIYKINKYDHCS